jgi:outer membrane biosynthesis protein TonB
VPCIKTNMKTTDSLKQNEPLTVIEYAQSAHKKIATGLTLLALTVLFVGCSSKRIPPHTPAPAPAPVVIAPAPAPAPVATAPSLPPAANWADYRRRAAQLILAANPGASFSGAQPPQWYGIATVTISFNADGSVRNVDLMRRSSISPEVNAMAVDAARRVGNFGSVGNLPQPWQFNETFLYNTDKLFQLDTIVANR